MFWNKYLLPSLVVLAAVGILNWIGGTHDYYWTVSWYDWVVHCLGGAWVALFMLWAAELPMFARFKHFVTPRNVIFAVFAVGIAWEIYELSFSITDFHDKGYTWDTAHDLLMDITGACLAVLTFKPKKI
jgi:hypothetical protein